jgi:N-acetylated-alpha-linked acidic dipeptidase
MKLRLVYPFCFFLSNVLSFSAEAPSLGGYSADAARSEREWETKFRAIPDPSNLRAYMQRMSAHPHHVGSPYDKDNAEWILSKLKEFGLDASIENFEVLFPTPKERVVELVEPHRFTAKLQEPPVPGDPTSSQQSEQLPSYNAYSADGDVTGPLVYVNYGIPADYDELERLSVSVKGAIVIARYGGSWRGIKPKVAAEHGAIGCLIYSDARDDGYSEGQVFPAGPMRPRDGVQRGSVMDMPVYPGDPLTPGVGATKDAKRLPISQAATLTKIPVLPISYGDAQPLLAAIGGRTVPAAWRGGLPITYRVGPGPAKVHLVVKSNWDLKTLDDVIARIPGSTYPDEWILRGNHHDAWVNGAEDPLSGTSAVLEEARGLGTLLREGWKPKRTILLCFWDGEEPGLLGSTEWAEAHAAELATRGAVYINSDTNTRGELRVEGSHTLEKFINSVAKDVEDPEAGIPVWNRLRFYRIAGMNDAISGGRGGGPSAAPDAGERENPRVEADLRIGALGSGSDYTAFLDHLGVASLNLGFGGEDREGIYHSIYDDFYWYTHFSDTDFRYGRALAQTAGTAAMRLADAELLPLDFDDLTATLGRYVHEVEKLARDEREKIIERNREIDEGLFAAIDDPRFPLMAPHSETVPPFLDFAPLENGLAALERSAAGYDQELAKAATNGGAALARASLREVNARLVTIERALTLNDGLPDRPWFRHQIYAPGLYTGYGVKTLPAVRESIEQKEWKLADEELAKVGKVLENTGVAIEGATTELRKAIGQ